MTALAVPEPTTDDPEDVATALETAAIFSERGDRDQMVHWVRRAAESAGENGHDHRAVELAVLAADLSVPSPTHPAAPLALAVKGDEALPPTSQRAPVPPSQKTLTPPSPPLENASSETAPPDAPHEPSGVITRRAPPQPRREVAAALNSRRRAPTRQAFHVAVRPDGAPHQFIVSLLEDGAEVPGGCYEAMLVLIEPSADLFKR